LPDIGNRRHIGSLTGVRNSGERLNGAEHMIMVDRFGILSLMHVRAKEDCGDVVVRRAVVFVPGEDEEAAL
jgi:hypothetical protein